MKICYIQFTYYLEQGNIDTYEYARILSDLGNTVHVIAVGRKGEEREDEIHGIKIHRIHFPLKKRRFLSFLFFLKAVKELNNLERMTGNFDIVHVYMSLGSCVVPLFGTRKQKYILGVRSGGITGRMWAFVAKVIINIESTVFDKVIVLDEGLARTLFGKRQDISIVPLGADFERFRFKKDTNMRETLGISENDIIFCYVGSVHKKRNLKNVISAFNVVTTQFENTKLLIVGEGENLENLRQLVRTLRLEDKVIFTGYVDYHMVPDVMNTATIAISYVPITPEYDHQPPLKTVEYMACELPTIATNTSGNRRFIQDEYNGILSLDDITSLSGAMIRLVRDRELREKLRKNARSSIREYDWKNIVETRLIPVYRGLLKDEPI